MTAAYTWGADGLVSEHLSPVSNNIQSLWYLYGPQGETRQLTNSAGTVTDTYNYSAYGQPGSVSGSDANPFQYGGKFGYYTENNGVVLCGHRWYDTLALRWLSRDPVGYKGGDNLYAYCGGDPVGGIDPDGLDPIPAHGPDYLRLPPGSTNRWHKPDQWHSDGHSDVKIPKDPSSPDPRLRSGATQWRWYPNSDLWEETKDSIDNRNNRKEAARNKKAKQDRANRNREADKERCKEEMDRIRQGMHSENGYSYGFGGFNPVNPPTVKLPEFPVYEPVPVPVLAP